jgi:hypothetical protein
MWTTLNDEGKKVWGHVFPDGKVPVCSGFETADLEGLSKTERVVLVDWTALNDGQRSLILTKLSNRSGASREAILEDISRIGLPLRECHTTGTIAAELRFFI